MVQPRTSGESAAPPEEQRFVIRGVSWKEYALLREALEVPGLRMTYCEGALELMSPSPEHELAKKMIARLIELFAIERDVPLNGWGSTTFRKQAAERGAEPDECYMLAPGERSVPDIAVEVVVTRPLIDKLDVYRGLGVPEVWLYEYHQNRFRLFHLGAADYESVDRSSLVPGLDFELLAAFARRRDQHEAVKEFRAALRGRELDPF